ncbi:LysR substrate-binding domain-containing protein [Palleronia sp. LCG004]|uniref:LysR substrate-binding domain-containing protein n=1 Tax=Palleronia sp. LCG004 TaxID=3079304 RepID=UPI002943475F|nr:LysR substrate-binding domain-containing protein [Palleronia sp. LCG004]WOI57878.1 LysR substrate-binding domain-containing protein [Palleronia sp. LCG004]
MTIHRGVKLRHLRIFLAVAEERTISAAARKLGVAQPSLSKAMADLEAMLGVELLARVGRGVVLTAEGTTFRRHAILALQQLETGAEAIQAGGSAGTIAVGVLPTAAGRLLPDAALDLRTRRPGLRLAITTGPHRHLVERLRANEIALMVGRMPEAAEMPGLRFEWLYDEEVVLVGRKDHPFALHDHAAALRANPLILPNRNAIIRRPVEDFLAVSGILDPVIAFETVSLAAGLRLLEGSDMLWFISRGVVERELRNGSLHRWRLEAPFLSGALGITTRREESPPEDVEALIDALSVVAARLRGSRIVRFDR